jgi:glycerol-3-phosphate dehydrogenase
MIMCGTKLARNQLTKLEMKTSKADVLVIGDGITGMTIGTPIKTGIQPLEGMKVNHVEALESLSETRLY